MRMLGAMPQVIALSEVRARLGLGAVDGTENTLSNFYTQNLHEVQEHLTLSDHGYLGYAVIVNKPFWDGLKPDMRAQLERAMKEATAYERRIAQDENDRALNQLKVAETMEIHVLSNQHRLAWQQALLPVHEQFADVLGRDTIQAIYRIAADVAREQKPGNGKTSGTASPPAVKK